MRPLLATVGILGLAAFSWACWGPMHQGIAAELTQKAQAALDANGLSDVTVEFDHLDGFVYGAKTNEVRSKARLLVLASVPAGRVVFKKGERERVVPLEAIASSTPQSPANDIDASSSNQNGSDPEPQVAVTETPTQLDVVVAEPTPTPTPTEVVSSAPLTDHQSTAVVTPTATETVVAQPLPSEIASTSPVPPAPVVSPEPIYEPQPSSPIVPKSNTVVRSNVSPIADTQFSTSKPPEVEPSVPSNTSTRPVTVETPGDVLSTYVDRLPTESVSPERKPQRLANSPLREPRTFDRTFNSPPVMTRPHSNAIGAGNGVGKKARIGIHMSGRANESTVTAVQRRSAAAQAGIRPGDIIISVGHRSVSEFRDLAAAVAEHRPGDEVEVVFRRAGKSALLHRMAVLQASQ